MGEGVRGYDIVVAAGAPNYGYAIPYSAPAFVSDVAQPPLGSSESDSPLRVTPLCRAPPPPRSDEMLITPWVFFRYVIIGTYVGVATVRFPIHRQLPPPPPPHLIALHSLLHPHTHP